MIMLDQDEMLNGGEIGRVIGSFSKSNPVPISAWQTLTVSPRSSCNQHRLLGGSIPPLRGGNWWSCKTNLAVALKKRLNLLKEERRPVVNR